MTAPPRNPIGVFDSGVGGLTVLQALRQRLPGEDYLYLGDTARLPYGSKSAATVQRYALNAAAHLVRHGIKLLVVACNTASSYALDEVAAASPVPVVGVVEPGVRAALATGIRRVGVIGTEGTIRSGAYQRALERADRGLAVDAVACPLFVPLAEEGWGDHPVTDQVADIYLRPLLDWGAEALILGCTGDYSELLDTSSGAAGDLHLQFTDASDRFLRITRQILDRDPEHLEVVDVT
jgi:glutamate racemase